MEEEDCCEKPCSFSSVTDVDVQKFIMDGYLILPTSLPVAFHQKIFKQTTEIFQEEGNPGNNILPRLPSLLTIFEQPNIVAILTALLGIKIQKTQNPRFLHFLSK